MTGPRQINRYVKTTLQLALLGSVSSIVLAHEVNAQTISAGEVSANATAKYYAHL